MIDHTAFTILPRTIATAAPSMAAEEIREDFELTAGLETVGSVASLWGDAFDC